MPRPVLAATLLFVIGCTRSATSPEAQAAALAKADEAAKALGKTLRTRLQEELPNGPVAAVKVCADEAQALTERTAKEQGVRVGRASLRTRNPKNAPPDWVRSWLETQGERAAEGVQGFARIDRTAHGAFARVVKPIPVEASCVVCHGAKESIAPEVATVLAERYPGDQATGYAPGDLRGALWAETPVSK